VLFTGVGGGVGRHRGYSPLRWGVLESYPSLYRIHPHSGIVTDVTRLGVLVGCGNNHTYCVMIVSYLL
jgi:hypothetical protein